MKKTILLSFLSLLFYKTIAQSPTWVGNTNPYRLYPSNLTTKVGIGTNNPQKALEVIGDISLPNNNGMNQIFTYAPNDNNWRIGMSATPGFTRSLTTSHVQFITYYFAPGQGFALGVSGGNSSFEIRGSDHRAFFRGRLGIGTTNPGAELEVNGKIKATNLNITNELLVNNTIKIGNNSLSLENNKIYLNQAETGPLFIQSQSYNKNTIINHNNSGCVGIGTDNPKRKLHVKSVYSSLIPEPPGGGSTSNNSTNSFTSNTISSETYLPTNVPIDSTIIGIPQNTLDSIANEGQYAGSLRLEVLVENLSPAPSSIWDIRPSASESSSDHRLIFVDAINNHTPLVITSDGYVGIGTISPINKLHVSNGNLLISGENSNLFFGDGRNNSYGGGDYAIEYIKEDAVNNNKSGLNFWKPAGSSQGQFTNFIFHLSDDGNVGIGTGTPNYKLDVNGIIRSRSEIIICSTDWCDFVFNSDYKLESFQARMQNIKKQKHLPWIKSENHVVEQGVSVSETIKGLLQNVEEMYLYMEQMQDRIENLEKENRLLQQQIK